MLHFCCADSLAPKRRQLPTLVPTTPAHDYIYSEAQRRRTARLAAVATSPHGAAQEKRMRLPPVTHREGAPSLAPAQQVFSH